MKPRIDPDPMAPGDGASSPVETRRGAYVAPALEYLGRWNALTLQQSVPVAGFQRHPDEGDPDR